MVDSVASRSLGGARVAVPFTDRDGFAVIILVFDSRLAVEMLSHALRNEYAARDW